MSYRIPSGESDHREIDPELYESMRACLLSVLAYDGHGLTFNEALVAMADRIDRDRFPRNFMVRWYARAVLVDLETRWLVERVPGSNPPRFVGNYRGARYAAEANTQ